MSRSQRHAWRRSTKSDLYQQPDETVSAYTQRMLAIIGVLHGRVQIAAGRSHDMDDAIAELQAIVDGDGKALAEIDLRRAVVALREYSSDAEIRVAIKGMLTD